MKTVQDAISQPGLLSALQQACAHSGNRAVALTVGSARSRQRAQAMYQRQGASTRILDLSGCVVSRSGENWEKFKGDEDTGGTEVRSGSTIRMWIPSRAQLAAHGIAVQTADPKAVAALGLATSTLKAGMARIDLSGAVWGEEGVPAACRG